MIGRAFFIPELYQPPTPAENLGLKGLLFQMVGPTMTGIVAGELSTQVPSRTRGRGTFLSSLVPRPNSEIQARGAPQVMRSARRPPRAAAKDHRRWKPQATSPRAQAAQVR